MRAPSACACPAAWTRHLLFEPTGHNARAEACLRCGALWAMVVHVNEPRPHQVIVVGATDLPLDDAARAWLDEWPRSTGHPSPAMLPARARPQDADALARLEEEAREAQNGLDRSARLAALGWPRRSPPRSLPVELRAWVDVWRSLRRLEPPPPSDSGLARELLEAIRAERVDDCYGSVPALWSRAPLGPLARLQVATALALLPAPVNEDADPDGLSALEDAGDWLRAELTPLARAMDREGLLQAACDSLLEALEPPLDAQRLHYGRAVLERLGPFNGDERTALTGLALALEDLEGEDPTLQALKVSLGS